MNDLPDCTDHSTINLYTDDTTIYVASHDKSVHALPPLFIVQATKVGRGGLGTRLALFHSRSGGSP